MLIDRLKRREFITVLGGAAVAWPLAARGQQADRMRRIGVLIGIEESDPEVKARLSGFMQGLRELGWTDGRTFEWTFGKPAASTNCGCSRKSWSI
jgi:putative ABC transport system substrate-binding protein